ncbi:MAG: MATE family efflux transporter [Marinifilaceae bacterium]|jgi:putative MATE family efflux protein|nr:MATE family efflux transporter [Marinifilaceae bacterium]
MSTAKLNKTTFGYKEIWKMTLPIIIGSIAQNLIAFTDTAFLGHLSEIDLGASALSTLFYYAVVMLALGFGIGVQIVIARRYGEGNFKLIGKTFDHALYFLLCLAFVMFILLKFYGNTVLSHLVESKLILKHAIDYIDYRCFGVFFAFVNLLFRSFFIGIGRTKIISISTVFMAAINIYLDYVLIFGEFGYPNMGIKGAALASVISEAFVTIFFLIAVLKSKKLKSFNLFGFPKLDIDLFKRLLNISFPMMLQNFIALSCWFIFFLLVEKMGERQLAVSNIIRSIYVLILIPVWAFASAANSLVSRAIGMNQSDQCLKIIFRTIVLSFISVIILVIFASINPRLCISIYTNSESVINSTLPVLYTILFAGVFFPIGITLFHGVSGTGRTLHALILEIIVLLIYMSAVYANINVFKFELRWVWTSEIIYATGLATASYLYLKYYKWHTDKV